MIRLLRSVRAWREPAFEAVLKAELESLDKDALPLQAGLSSGSYVSDQERHAMIIRVAEDGESILAKAGIFYTGILIGCACSDDPTPSNEASEYCELQLLIDKRTGETTVSPIAR